MMLVIQDIANAKPNIIFTLYFLYCIFPHAAYITGFICNRRANIVFKFFLAVVRKECACMSSYLALQIPHQKVISFKTTFQPERFVYTPVNRNLLFTKICWYKLVKMLRYRYLLLYSISRYSLEYSWYNWPASSLAFQNFKIQVQEIKLEIFEPFVNCF